MASNSVGDAPGNESRADARTMDPADSEEDSPVGYSGKSSRESANAGVVPSLDDDVGMGGADAHVDVARAMSNPDSGHGCGSESPDHGPVDPSAPGKKTIKASSAVELLGMLSPAEGDLEVDWTHPSL